MRTPSGSSIHISTNPHGSTRGGRRTVTPAAINRSCSARRSRTWSQGECLPGIAVGSRRDLEKTLSSLVVGPRTVDQLTGQLVSLQVALNADLLDEIDRVVPPGGVVVPYYLDDSFANFRPQPYHR